eukprot:scaffold2611_cov43-Cyclotella_meneghiniana.AAC.5
MRNSHHLGFTFSSFDAQLTKTMNVEDSGSRQSAEYRGCWARPDNLPTTNDPIQSLFCSPGAVVSRQGSCVMCRRPSPSPASNVPYHT